MTIILSIILAGVKQTLQVTAGILNGIASLIQIYEFLFSKVEPQVSGMYKWTYNTAKNLEALVKAFNELNKISIELNKEAAPEVQARVDRWAEEFKAEAEKLIEKAEEFGVLVGQPMLMGQVRRNQARESLQDSFWENVLSPAVGGIKKGYDYIKEKVGGFFKEHPIMPQPYLTEEYKDYRYVPEMTNSTELPPGPTAAKMTPEAYADLIVAAIPEAIKRQREMGGAGVAGKTAEPEGRSVTEGDVIAIALAVAEKITGEAAQGAAGPGGVPGEAAGRGRRDEEGRTLSDADIAAVQAAVSNSLSYPAGTGAGPGSGSSDLTQTASANHEQLIQLLTAFQGGEDQIFLYQQLAYSDLVAIRNQLKEMGCDPISNMYDHRNMKI